MKLKSLLLGTSLSLIPNLTYAQCSPAQSCAELGYKETANKGGCLKCPFGNGWHCPPPKEEKAVLGQCTGYAKNCKIADILNSDGTCSNDKVSGKTPIGVVVYISGGSDKCGYAMTASPIATNIKWSTENVSTGAFQSSNWETAITDFDVRGNMTKIIQTANGNSSKYPAAYTALNYAPSAILTSKGKWALPTAGILNSLYTNLNAINNTISKLGGKKLTNDNEHIWSSASNEYGDNGWVFCRDRNVSGAGVYIYGKNTDYHAGLSETVRPVLVF